MDCTLCGKPVVLVPSAQERAAKDNAGHTAACYTALFPQHAHCILAKREGETRELMARVGGRNEQS